MGISCTTSKQAQVAVWFDEPMALHTSLGVGGPAERYAVAENLRQLRELLDYARENEMSCLVIGSGTNLLVADGGVRGLVVENRLSGMACRIAEEGISLEVGSGAQLSEVARYAVRRGWAGLEWAVDLPGTVGGAVVGNAGAFGGYCADVVVAATVLQPGGELARFGAEQLGFGYRTSGLKGWPKGGIRPVITQVELGLWQGDVALLEHKAWEYGVRRRARQPEDPSAGSVFKRTAHHSAGYLIERVGLKGYRVGDAQISPRHANFIVNLGRAGAADVKALIDLARARVRERFGLELELEIELVGEW